MSRNGYCFTEQDAWQLCDSVGLLSPVYAFTDRGGCWFCPNAKRAELRHLYDHHPDLWARMLELQAIPGKTTEKFNRTQKFSDIDAVFRSNTPIIMFPAGLVSRKRRNGIISDLKWHKMFVNKAIQYERDIIPVYFDAQNSPFFYNFAKFRLRIGLRFNFEMMYLPREIFRSRNACFRLVVGDPIAWQSLEGGRKASRQAQKIKKILYSLSNQPFLPDDDDDQSECD